MAVYGRFLKGKYGLEIGGPSNIFGDNGVFPVYSVIGRLDGCNFAESTIWEGDIKPGNSYLYHSNKKKGRQFICDAVDLAQIPSGRYDFVLSSHVIEHIANPVKALLEWIRVLKDGGILLLVVPLGRKTFDHKRPTTTIKHIIDDFKNDITEKDLTHLTEILRLHDISLDPPAGSIARFKKRSIANYYNRALHHHVFNARTVSRLFDILGLKMLFLNIAPPYHIIAIGRKSRKQIGGVESLITAVKYSKKRMR